MLVTFSGLPGTGKSTLARQLAEELGAVYLRIDTIERAIAAGDETIPIGDEGYRVAYALAEDNLRLGLTVIGDSVNPLQITRNAWRGAAKRAAVRAVEIEVICSDQLEHRRRIETRAVDVPVTWDEVVARHYEAWVGNHITVDTAGQDIAQTFAALLRELSVQVRS
jgi:predicted kinase